MAASPRSPQSFHQHRKALLLPPRPHLQQLHPSSHESTTWAAFQAGGRGGTEGGWGGNGAVWRCTCEATRLVGLGYHEAPGDSLYPESPRLCLSSSPCSHPTQLRRVSCWCIKSLAFDIPDQVNGQPTFIHLDMQNPTTLVHERSFVDASSLALRTQAS